MLLMWEGRLAALEFQALVGGSENKKKYLLEKKRGGNFFPLKEQFLPFVDFLPPTTCMLY